MMLSSFNYPKNLLSQKKQKIGWDTQEEAKNTLDNLFQMCGHRRLVIVESTGNHRHAWPIVIRNAKLYGVHDQQQIHFKFLMSAAN